MSAFEATLVSSNRGDSSPTADSMLGLLEQKNVRAKLLRLVMRRGASLDSAEDVLQNTWLKLRTGKTQKPDNPMAYVSMAVLKTWNTRFRGEITERALFVPIESETTFGSGAYAVSKKDIADVKLPSEEDIASVNDLCVKTLGAIDKLPPRSRRIAISAGLGYTYEEIGKREDSTPNAIEQMLTRIRKQLREETGYYPEEETVVKRPSSLAARATRHGSTWQAVNG